MSKLNIIIATYNSESTIQDTLDSIYNQTWKDYEIIVIDGCSKDATCDIIKRNSKKIKYFISEPDSGIYDALNKGILQSDSEWIYFMGSDDLFYDNRVLEDVFNSVENSNFDLVYGNVIFKQTKKIYDGKFYKIKMHFRNICHQAIFYRRSIFDRLGLFNLKYPLWADYEFNMRCFGNKQIKIKYINRVISIYNDDGLSSKREDEAFKIDRGVLIKKYFGDMHYLFYVLRRFYQIIKKKIVS
ncbi:MAG: glycosyltransferase [Proteobacteria bacterium]|nr:glycosyltransferase [Pseudomonadota bacterium]